MKMYYRGYILIRLKVIVTEWKFVDKLNEDDTLLMEVDANTKIKIEKSSISLELSKKESKEGKEKKDIKNEG